MQATLADRLGLNGPQEKNNSDNTKILADYVRRYHEETKKYQKKSKITRLSIFLKGTARAVSLSGLPSGLAGMVDRWWEQFMSTICFEI